MATLDFRQLQMLLSKKKYAHIYFIYGNESFLIDKAVQLIKKSVLTEASVDFNFDSFYSSENSIYEIKDVIETLPAMSLKRMVVLKQVHLLKELDWENLNSVIENPVESTVFVLVADKIDKRKKFFKTLSKSSEVVEIKKPYENKVLFWIQYLAQEAQINLDQDAALLMHELIGSNLYELNNEIEKLKNFVKEKTRVTSQDVLEVVSRAKIISVFDLASAIGKNDKILALSCLANLLAYGHNEIGALQLIARHIRILSQVQRGVERGLAPSQLASQIGVPQFFLKDYMQQSKIWTKSKLDKSLTAIYYTDKALKSSPVSSHIWLENFILMTCRAEAALDSHVLA